MSVNPVSALPDATLLDWGFTHDVDLLTRSLRLTFVGSDPQKFGVPELTSALVELRSVETGRYTLESASLQDAATVVAVLRQDMPTGWYDVTLTLVDNLTGLRRTATEVGLVFGDVTRAVLAIEPTGRAFRFGNPLTLRLVEPVGRTLAQIGVTPERLQPRLRRAEDPNFGAVVDSVAVSAVRDRTIDLVLNPRYADYSSTDPLHAVDPGFASVVPLSIPVADLPSFQLLPIQLTTEVLGRVLQRLVRAVPAAPTVLPGSPATWHLSNVSLDQLSNPGLDPIVFTEVKRLLSGSNIKVAVTGSLAISARADHTGYAGPRAKSTSTASPSLHPLAFTHVADFGVLRPPVIHHGSGAPVVGVDGAAVTLTAQLSATVNEPHVYTGTVTTPLAAIPTIWQLPIAVPTLAVLTDKRYEQDFATPGGNVLLLAPRLFTGAVSSPRGSLGSRARMLVDALRLLDQVLPAVRRVWPDVPGADLVIQQGPNGPKSPVTLLADWIEQAPTVTVVGDSARTHLGALGAGHPNWEDVPSAAVLVGLPFGSGRTLRLFSERTTDITTSAYLELRVRSGQLQGALWTLHESVFQDGFGVRPPFQALTEPLPKQQCDTARTTARPDMPWFVFTGYSFGNVTSAYAWV